MKYEDQVEILIFNPSIYLKMWKQRDSSEFQITKNNFGNSIALESKGSNYVPNKLMLLS